MSNNLNRLFIYIAITLICGLFSYIYEQHSHQVYSNYMVYLFAIPLVLGAIPQFIAVLNLKLNVGGSWIKIIHNFAIATLTIGSLLKGMLEIYGTTSKFIPYYFVIGASLLAVSIAMWMVSSSSSRRA